MRLNPSRRALVGGGIAAMATMSATSAAAESAGSAGRPQPPDRTRALSRAVAAYAALEKRLATKDGSGLVREQYPAAPADNAYSYEWPYSQVHIAARDLAAERAKAQEHYWNAGGGTTEPPGYDSYRSFGLSRCEPDQPHAPNGLGRTGPWRTRPRGGDTHPVRGPVPGGPRGRRPLMDTALRDLAIWVRPEATGRP